MATLAIYLKAHKMSDYLLPLRSYGVATVADLKELSPSCLELIEVFRFVHACIYDNAHAEKCCQNIFSYGGVQNMRDLHDFTDQDFRNCGFKPMHVLKTTRYLDANYTAFIKWYSARPWNSKLKATATPFKPR